MPCLNYKYRCFEIRHEYKKVDAINFMASKIQEHQSKFYVFSITFVDGEYSLEKNVVIHDIMIVPSILGWLPLLSFPTLTR